MKTLVVGAGGVLAPAARALADRGDEVTGVALTPDGIPHGVEPLIGDGHDPATFAGRTWDRAILYLPAGSVEAVADPVTGPVVRVAVTAAADPAHGEFALQPRVLQLGWTDGRWHTPAEISAVALEVLDDGAGRLLGVVRPWSDRPL